jgi:RNA recognition motif-containing protein
LTLQQAFGQLKSCIGGQSYPSAFACFRLRIRSHEPASIAPKRQGEFNKLFVGNLPYSATEADITDFFSQAGVAVDSVNVMRDRFTGESRGFGFVEINDDTAANHAVEACNGRDLMGRAMVVNEARPMVPREGYGGGGGRRESGGGRRSR